MDSEPHRIDSEPHRMDLESQRIDSESHAEAPRRGEKTSWTCPASKDAVRRRAKRPLMRFAPPHDAIL